MPPECHILEVFLKVDSGHAGVIVYLTWLGTITQEKNENIAGEREYLA